MGLFDGISIEYPLGQNSFPTSQVGADISDITSPWNFAGIHNLVNQFGGIANKGNALGVLNKVGTNQMPAAPNPNQATMDALRSQLNNELQMRRSAFLLTGGEGLSESPDVKSAGQLLFGEY